MPGFPYRSLLQRSGCTLHAKHEPLLQCTFCVKKTKLKRLEDWGCNTTAHRLCEKLRHRASCVKREHCILVLILFSLILFSFFIKRNFIFYTLASSEFTHIIRYLGCCRHSTLLIPATQGQGNLRGKRNR